MKKVFNLSSDAPKKLNNDLLKIYKLVNSTESTIHNLVPEFKIPFLLKVLLTLGLSFSLPKKPNFKGLVDHFDENIRKFGWMTYFKLNESDNNYGPIEKINKELNKYEKNKKSCDEINNSLFPQQIKDNFINTFQQNTQKHEFFSIETLNGMKAIIKANNLIIKPADKNSGVSIMRIADYDQEVYRQLEDLNFYKPTSEYEYNNAMDLLGHKVKINNQISIAIKKLIPKSHSPASFYILPKLHKEFTKFPKGRPISNSSNTFTRGFSKLLDSCLQPITNFLSEIIIDTPHLLLLLQNLKLDKMKKYALVCIDIESLYTNLNIDNCKTFCYDLYKKIFQFL